VDVVDACEWLTREKLVKIGAKLVVHGRYMTFQMAEVAVPQSVSVHSSED
jgi:hypothetical protein